MARMSVPSPVYIPPVYMESFSEFKEVARQAAVVVFSPEYLQGPFMNDETRLRRLTLAAVGVKRNEIPLTFKFVVNHECALQIYREADPSTAVAKMASDIMQELEHHGNVIQGSIDSEIPPWELLEVRP